MTLAEWVRRHRAELDEAIQKMASGVAKNDRERALWVLNEEGLYLWAKSEGVDV